MPDGPFMGSGHTTTCFAPSASIPDAPWYCVYTKPQQERATEHRIRVQGSAVWLPLESVRLANRQTVIRPIFQRYLFVQAYPWNVIRNAGGEEMARVLLSPARKPLELPPGELETLFAQCAPNGVIYAPEPREVTRGDRVTIEDGPFTSFSGICRRTSRDRIWILLNLFGRPQEVPFSRRQVELV